MPTTTLTSIHQPDGTLARWLRGAALGLGLLSAQPALAYFDASVDVVYVQGQVPAGLGRGTVQARITNSGSQTLVNLPVTLSISGSNSFSNVKSIASLAVGASINVTFDSYGPTVQGYDYATVSVPTDTYSFNNSAFNTIEVTTSTFAYPASTDVSSRTYRLPDNGQDGILSVKLTSNGPARVTAVSNFIPNVATNVGQPITGVVLSAQGTILARSATYIMQSSDLGTYHRLPLLTPVTVQGDFLAGVLVDNNQYYPVGTDAELPARQGAFYSVRNASYGGPPNEAITLDGSTTKGYIVAELAAVVACANPTNLRALNVTGTSAQLTFDAGVGNTSYVVSYGPAGGAITQTQTVTTSPVTIGGLVPGAAYTATVTGSCGATTATPPARLYFGTVPPNDQCAGSNTPQLACGQSVTGSTLGSTNTNDPTGSFGLDQIWPESGGVFYRLTGTGSNVTLNMCSSAEIYDAQLFVLTGSCGNLNIVASNDDGCGQDGDATMSLVTFPTTAGLNYFIYVTGYTGGRGEFTLTATCGALPDLVVSSYQNVPGGAYRNVTVTGPTTGGAGTAYLTAPLNVAGTLTIMDGGALLANCHAITGSGSFALAAGGALGICDAVGITLTDNAGAVRVSGTRTFSNDATYIYNGVSTQVPGDAFPTRVRGLTVDNANNLTLATSLTVAQVLRLTDGNLVTGGNTLLLPSTAAGTALVHHEGTGNVVGTATVQRYLTPGANGGLGYRHYSSPVSNSTVSDLAVAGWNPTVGTAYNSAAVPGATLPFPTVYSYDQTRLATAVNDQLPFDKGWLSPASGSTPLAVGRGYTVNLPAAALVDFRGTLNTGNVVLNLGRGPAADAGWAFVGNPYAAPLNWSLVSAADRTGVSAAMYVYESSSQYAGAYRSYTNGIGVGNPEIPSGQGFFVRVAAGQSAGTLTLRNAHRVTSYGTQAAFHRPAADVRPLVELTLAGGNAPADATHVYFEAGATPDADAEFDAEKIFNPTGLSIYSEAAGTPLAINGLAPAALRQGTIVPLTLRVPALTGSYTISATSLRNLAGVAVGVFLVDAATGQRVDLQRQASYTFPLTPAEAPTGILAGRFSLHFGPTATIPGLQVGTLDGAAISLYPNPAKGHFTVLLPGRATASTAKLALLNSLGQPVLNRTLALPATGLSTEVDAAALPAGVYSLRVSLPGQAPSTQRVVLR